MRHLFILLLSCITATTTVAQDIDVFYIISTEVLKATDDQGNEVFNSRLIPADTLNMYAEREYVRSHHAKDMRLICPYYEQFTFSALSADDITRANAYAHAKADLKRQFEDYMQNTNNGRPFALVGFSQGAMIALDLLKEMTDEQYSHCLGAYMMGYRIAAADTVNTRVRPAAGEIDGNAISFNSVIRPEATFHSVADGAFTCINPLNWRTDSVPATLIYHGDTATVRVDTDLQQLVVSGLDEDKYVFPLFPRGNLHHWDLLFYSKAINENIKRRANHKI